MSALQRKVAYLLGKKQYRQALEAMAPNDRLNQSLGMEGEYLTALNGLVQSAEEAMGRNDYLCAGQALRKALAVYPAEKTLRRKIKSGARRIRINLGSCAARLMDQGMQEYRQGELDRAIRTWQSILSFDAGFIEARKAIETATVQQRSLQVMEK